MSWSTTQQQLNDNSTIFTPTTFAHIWQETWSKESSFVRPFKIRKSNVLQRSNNHLPWSLIMLSKLRLGSSSYIYVYKVGERYFLPVEQNHFLKVKELIKCNRSSEELNILTSYTLRNCERKFLLYY